MASGTVRLDNPFAKTMQAKLSRPAKPLWTAASPSDSDVRLASTADSTNRLLQDVGELRRDSEVAISCKCNLATVKLHGCAATPAHCNLGRC
jgi:hypothetical protein